jgi:hypothetical protein
MWEHSDKLNQKSETWLFLLQLLILAVVYPFWWVLRFHRRINDLYVAGEITEQAPGSPLNEVLEVAEEAMNGGLFQTMTIFGVLLGCTVFWKLA